jgi:hypothetical protein
LTSGAKALFLVNPLIAALKALRHPKPFVEIAPTIEFMVELTGIEPVASWLQTRRSPS